MKKFLIFLTAIVVIVTLGLTTYYFLQNNETINFKTKTIYCNVGDVVTIEDLGKVVKKQYKKTTYNYNAGGDEVKEYISYNDTYGYYIANKGGETDIVITTSNTNFPEFKIRVIIGDGSETNPYFIKNQSDLTKINTLGLDKSYCLLKSVTLDSSFTPIGYVEGGTDVEFTGTFLGNGLTIYNLNISTSNQNAGLFSTLGSGSVVKDLIIKNSTINCQATNVGVLAGQIKTAKISSVIVQSANITTDTANVVVGGLAGEITNYSEVIATGVSDVNITSTTTFISAGGFAGEINNSYVKAAFATGTISTPSAIWGKLGGFTSLLTVDESTGSIQESYADVACSTTNFGGFIGKIDSSSVTSDADRPLKYLKHLAGNYCVGTNAINNYDTAYFQTLYSTSSAIYAIATFSTETELKQNTDYIYYANSSVDLVRWDESVWLISQNQLPTLIMNPSTLTEISEEYFRRGALITYISTADDLMNAISACRSTDGAIKEKSYQLTNDIDLKNYSWTPIDLILSSFDGAGHKIKNITITSADTLNQVALFGTVSSSTIKNLTLENVTIDVASQNIKVAGFAGKVAKYSTTYGISEIKNVNLTTITLSDNVTTVSSLSGIANTVTDSSRITADENEANIINFTLTDTRVANISGLVQSLSNSSILSNCDATVKLNAKTTIAGLVKENSLSKIDNCNGVVTIEANSASIENVSGLVCENKTDISNTLSTTLQNCNVEVVITLKKVAEKAYIGGVCAKNYGHISDITITGSGIAVDSTITTSEMYIGGLVGLNNHIIEDCNCYLENIGTCLAGKLFSVGGLAVELANKEASATSCIITSNLSGNYVAGVVVKLSHREAAIDQVVVGKITSKTVDTEQQISIDKNTITGDRLVAGVSIHHLGQMTNVQSASQIVGKKTGSVYQPRVSLITLVFPNGASLKNSTIDSTFGGVGVFYRETWVIINQITKDSDAAKYYGLEEEDSNRDNMNFYEIYANDASHGSMQSVVVNDSCFEFQKAGDGSIKNPYWSYATISGRLIGHTSYENTDESSYVKGVGATDFHALSAYTEDWSYTPPKAILAKRLTFTRSMTFSIGDTGVWKFDTTNNTLTLNFVKVDNLIAQ